MAPCSAGLCSYGFETVTNSDVGQISGSYRTFVEVMAFMIFIIGVALNTGILTVLISAYPNLDHFDGFLMNLAFGELVASFGIAFVFFVEFTTSLAPIGDNGCRFLTWLDVTSVTITITALVTVTYELHYRIYYNRSNSMSRGKFIVVVALTWFIASLPGLPYVATAKMGDDNFCFISHWSHDAEILYICAMLIFQILTPLALIVFMFVRIFIVMRRPREGDAMLTDDTNPGSEANFQRAVIKRKVIMTCLIAACFYVILIIVAFTQLSLALNLDNIENNPHKYARLREGNALLECLKCIFVPMFYLAYYDKLRNQFKRLCCRKKDEIYNSLRYDVYQQTVQETSTEPNAMEENHEETNDLDTYMTERDDVAILDNEA